ncbi:HlyD family secretion protein [uncultured Ferrimonas sp.]|uniref:HlyD family secretion protein n=1 Tax=uncultured Ferrimonas sp. TaxID=432640 RepID=UPI00260FE98C|nr:HlyD family secretion protein [uncultured Ferrimonas sp.]
MASKVYQWALSLVFAASVLFSVFLVASDNLSPFTTQAQLHLSTSRLAAEVSGPVSALAVRNGQQVEQGQLLVQLDPTRYQLALAQTQAALIEAQQSHQAKRQQLRGAEASLHQRLQQAQNAERKWRRNQQLIAKGLQSQQVLDDSQAEAAVSQQAVQAAQAEIAKLQAELVQSSDSGALAAARSRVKLAQLDLAKTRIVAPISGVISNLNLNLGSYVSAGSPVLFLVDRQHSWVNADFNEKGVNHLQAGTAVRLVFDALPGEVFSGTVQGRDLAIYDPSSEASGLAKVTNDDRWIRDQQKVRTQIVLPQLNDGLFSGSKVSVMVVSDLSWWDLLGQLWMQLLAQLRYLI